jgi:hypothetical protein
MGKVCIGLRGWRFDEEAVFDREGAFRPMDEMPEETSTRLSRLTALVNRPCDACWLIHGDEEVERCNPAAVVYGEPMAEVLLCDDHEPDFVYWFREAGGGEYRGTDDVEDAFHEWFADGGRAPGGYAGLSHVDTDPDELPDPEAVLEAAGDARERPADGRIEVEDANSDTGAADPEAEPTEADAEDVENLDLSREYPR